MDIRNTLQGQVFADSQAITLKKIVRDIKKYVDENALSLVPAV